MKVKRYHLVSEVTGFNAASVVLAAPDDMADEEIPFEDLWEALGVIWGDVQIEEEGPAELEDAEDIDGDPDYTLTRDEQGNIVIEK